MAVPYRVMTRLAAMCALLATAGCGGVFHEQHLMATVDPKTGETVNIFRIRVDGHVELGNARYLAGFYDERAVEAFFNESKSQPLADINLAQLPSVPSFFPQVPCKDAASAECKDATAAAYKTVPLGSKAGDHGVFVMILSTNPDAIAGTIGAFADNDQVVQSAMALATRSDREAAAKITARAGVVSTVRTGVAGEVDALLTADADGTAPDRARYIAALAALASGLAPGSAPKFNTVDAARSWFAALPRGAAQ